MTYGLFAQLVQRAQAVCLHMLEEVDPQDTAVQLAMRRIFGLQINYMRTISEPECIISNCQTPATPIMTVRLLFMLLPWILPALRIREVGLQILAEARSRLLVSSPGYMAYGHGT